MNTFDLALITSLAVIILFGLILGLSRGGIFFLTLCGAVSISTFVMIPIIRIINQQQWFIDLSGVFLGYDRLNVVAYFILLSISSLIMHFVLHLLLKFVGRVVADEKFASHMGGLILGILNGALLLIATLLIFDFMNGKVEVTSLESVYSSFIYSYLKPVLTFVNRGN